jgi:glycosyltransferase involved in cell wall biosynthesis
MALSVMQVIGDSAVGSAERHLLDLVQGLCSLGVDIEVVCPQPGPLSQQLTTRNVRVQYIDMVRSWSGDEYVLDGRAVRHLISLLRQKQPDVVHSHLYPAYLHASIAAQQVGIRAIVQTAHTLVARPGDGILSYLTAARTIAVSRAAARPLAHVGVPAERIEVIYNGVGPEHFENDREAQQRVRTELHLKRGPIIGVVSQLSSEKGIDVLLYAVQRLIRVFPGVTVLIIGDGPQATKLQQLAQQLGLDSTVHFLGERSDIPILNRLLDLFVLPSHEEASPMALLEAMAAGRAVIATAVGGTPELVTHGVDGWLVPPDDSQALTQAMLALLEDPSRRATLVVAAYRKVATQFTCDRMIQQTLSFYQRILAERPRLASLRENQINAGPLSHYLARGNSP